MSRGGRQSRLRVQTGDLRCRSRSKHTRRGGRPIHQRGETMDMVGAAAMGGDAEEAVEGDMEEEVEEAMEEAMGVVSLLRRNDVWTHRPVLC